MRMQHWHHAIHQVTGEMAKEFNRPEPFLKKWAEELEAVADEMRAALKPAKKPRSKKR